MQVGLNMCGYTISNTRWQKARKVLAYIYMQVGRHNFEEGTEQYDNTHVERKIVLC